MHFPSFSSLGQTSDRSEWPNPNHNSSGNNNNAQTSGGQEFSSMRNALRPHNSCTGSGRDASDVCPESTTSTTMTMSMQQLCSDYFARMAPLSSLHHHHHHSSSTVSTSCPSPDLGTVLAQVSELTLQMESENQDPDFAAFTPNHNSHSVKRNSPSTPTTLQKRFSWSSLEQNLKRTRRGSGCSRNDLVVVESGAPPLPSSPDLEEPTTVDQMYLTNVASRTMQQHPSWRRYPAPLISPSIVRFHLPPQAPVMRIPSEPPLHLDEHTSLTTTLPSTTTTASSVTSTASSSDTLPPPPPPMPLMSTPDLVPRRVVAPNLLKMRSSDAAFLPLL